MSLQKNMYFPYPPMTLRVFKKGVKNMKIVEPIRDKSELKRVEKILGKNKRDLLFFVLGTNSGLRISDILALNVEDVKDKEFIDIEEKKTGKQKKFPINQKLKQLICEYIIDKPDDDPLFMTKFKNRLERCNAYIIVKTACQEAGIKYKIGTHTLRKTFGYHHYQQFKDVVILQKIFNHSSPSITLRYIGIEQDEIFESYQNFVL